MYTFRLVLSLCLFCVGLYLIFDLFLSGFNFIILISSIICFVLAHYLKPKESESEDLSTLSELVNLIVDIPFRAIAFALRSIGRVFKGDVDSIDL